MLGRHCDQDEENDPAPEYEDPLECTVCGAFCRFHSPNVFRCVILTVIQHIDSVIEQPTKTGL